MRRPFLYMGALYGLGAGILSWALLAYSLNWLNGSVVNLSGLYGSDFGLQGVPLDDGLSLTVGAVLLGWSAPGWPWPPPARRRRAEDRNHDRSAGRCKGTYTPACSQISECYTARVS